MMDEWIDQEIDAVHVGEGDDGEYHRVGRHGVTKIERAIKSGMHAHISYVRVWKGEAAAEFCQHQIVAVYFKGFLP